MKCIWIWLIGQLTVFLFIVSADAQASDRETTYVKVSFALDSPITFHEPVAIDMLIENISPYGITLDLGVWPRFAYDFDIIAPDGMHVDPFPMIDKQRYGTRYLDPGGKYRQRILLNRWFAFDIMGDYCIRASLHLPIIEGKTELPWIMEQDENGHQTEETVLNLKILPRDETALKKRCEELFQKLQKATYFTERTPIAEELSYINDVIAIPYMVKLVEEREESHAIQGLMRIGTDEAFEAMIAVTQSEYDKGAADHAKAILRERIYEIRDMNIRKKVLDAIE
jgi:hypothetical protein